MGIYGMGQGQALGQGTFNFDRICPNRYLLDSLANKDNVLPGRYALVEYDRPIAVIQNFEGSSEEQGQIFYKLTYQEKQYDIIKGQLTATIVNENNIDFSLTPYDNPYSEGETPVSQWQILVCQKAENEKYNYYIANYPFPEDNENGISTILGAELKFQPFIKDNEGESISITPYTFNRLLDKAYVEMDISDSLTLTTYDLWDSTAWLKIVNAENKYEYVNVASLNVLTPTFTVLDNSTTAQEIIPLISTFNLENGVTTATTPDFNVPKYQQGQNANFNVRYPNPMDIKISINTSSASGSDTATYVYTKDSKNYTFKFPSIKKATTSATNAASSATNAASSATNAASSATNAINDVKKLIKYPRNDSQWPDDEADIPNISNAASAGNIPSEAGVVWQAIKAAYQASENSQGAIINTINTNSISVSIGKSTTLINNKLNIETEIDSSRIITAATINTWWGS